MENRIDPVIRFKGFNEEWIEKKLGDVAEIVRGASPRPIKDPKWFDVKSSIGWLRISDVTAQDGKIYYLQQRISKLGEEKTRVLHEPHLLLSIAASVGKPVINYVHTGVHDGFLIFKSPKFSLNFLFYWMKMFEIGWQSYGQPGSQVNLNSDIVKGHSVLLPKLPEQKKIGTFFQNIDQLITLHQKQYDKLVILKKAMLTKMFPREGKALPEIRFKGFNGEWVEKKIITIADRYNNLRVPIKANKRIPGSTPYYGANGIQDFVEGFTHEGEFVLIAEDGANDLKDYPVRYVKGKIWVNNHAHVLTAKKHVADNKFLKYAIKNLNIEPFLVGGGRAKLNSEVMMQMNIIISVDLLEQQKIGNYFKNLDQQITLHQTQLDKLTNIKKACLSKMFVSQA